MTKTKKNHQRAHRRQPRKDEKLPFVEHLRELRRRLIYIGWSVFLFGAVGYFIEHKLVAFLLKPSAGQKFIYTAPLGGLNFLFQICLYFGIVLSIPVIIYQLFRYLEPLINHHTRRAVLQYSVWSGILAVVGGAFGYVIGLPLALHFLSHQFITSQIQALLTIQEYMSFVTIYLLGSALLFQLPLVILFINRIRPLKPTKLLSYERYVVLGAFVAAAIMTPTTDIFSQLFFAVPIMTMYQVAIVLIVVKNRRRPAPEPAYSRPAIPPVFDTADEPQPAYTPSPAPVPLQPLAPSGINFRRRSPVSEVSYSRRAAPTYTPRSGRLISDVIEPYSASFSG